MPDGIKGIDKKNLPLMDMVKTIGTNGDIFFICEECDSIWTKWYC